MSLLSENVKVKILMGMYFSLNCIAFSYVAFYLGRFGIENSTIGMLVSVFAVFGFILQGTIGRFIDTHPKWYWRNLLLIMGSIELIICVLIFSVQLMNMDVLIIEILYGMLIMNTFAMAPLVNSSSFYYTAHGMPVNFSTARGVGSLVFAVASYILGVYSEEIGIIFIPSFGVAISILFLISVLILPGLGSTYGERETSSSRKPFISKGFFKRNRYFIIMVIGICMPLTLHYMVNSFLIKMIEHVGGSSVELGLALSIAAVCELPMFFLYDRIVKKYRFSTQFLIVIAAMLFVIRGILYHFAGDVLFIYVIQTMQCVTYALLIASQANYADESVSPQDKASGQSMMSMAETVGFILGTSIGGWTITMGGVNLMYDAGILIAFIGLLIVFSMYVVNRRKKPHLI